MAGTRARLLLNPWARRGRDAGGVAAGNGRYCGSALPVAEDAAIDDVHTIRAQRVEIRTRVPRTFNLDGELGPSSPATVAVVPRSLAVLPP